MKKSNFPLSFVSAVPLTALAANNDLVLRLDKGFKVNASGGRSHGCIQLKCVNAIMDLKVSVKDTNGDLAIFEDTGLLPRRGKGCICTSIRMRSSTRLRVTTI